MSPTPIFDSVTPVRPGHGGRPALTAAASIGVHAAALLAVVVVPLLSEDRLPEAAGEVQAFFAAPLELAPPPPPPPPPAPARVAPRVEAARPVPSGGFVAPVEVPTEIVPEAGLDLGLEGGVAGGVEGGVPGGVVGGIVGGLPEAPPPPPVQPVRVGGVVKEPRRVKYVPPVYPGLAVTGRIEGAVVLECIVDVRGRVQDLKILRGLPLLDEAAIEAVRRWAYTPTLIDGVPVPVIMTVTVNFRLR
jgi:protein TonB